MSVIERIATNDHLPKEEKRCNALIYKQKTAPETPEPPYRNIKRSLDSLNRISGLLQQFKHATLHGGIQATLMDEIGGWIIARKFQTSGMTTNLNIKYKKPIPTGENVKIEIRGHVKEVKRNFVFIETSISLDGTVCSTAEMTYYTFSKDIAEKDFMFSGCEVEE